MEFRCGGRRRLRFVAEGRGDAQRAAAEEAWVRGLSSRAAVCPRPRHITIGSCAMCTAEELPPYPAHA
jgi:hypothetical protein